MLELYVFLLFIVLCMLSFCIIGYCINQSLHMILANCQDVNSSLRRWEAERHQLAQDYAERRSNYGAY